VTSESPEQAADAKPQVWFLETSALVTLGVHRPLQQAVVAALSPSYRMLVKAVVTELQELSKTSDITATWAGTALGQLEWLGEAVALDDPVGVELAVQVQEEIAGGRPLKHPMEHFGEAAVISLASRAQKMKALMLCDDYGARVAAKNRNVQPVSVHKLMHLMIRQGKLTATEAATFADALHTAGRHPDYTAQELASGRLGRVGQP
jgi:hypothetical protein